MIRHATAVWSGSGKEGLGNITTASNVLNNTPYSFPTRFENAPGTNPEELIAAAHAGCFSMKLSFVMGNSGFVPQELNARCEITFEDGMVKKSHIILKTKVEGLDSEKFAVMVKDAELNCPISKLFSVPITVDASLNT